MKRLFFERVHWLVRQIPEGKVTTYGQLARMLGAPRAARTVGWALRAKPQGDPIPWQRVVNAQGAISLSAASADFQRALLEAEGIVFNAQDRIDLELYGWAGPDTLELYRLENVVPP